MALMYHRPTPKKMKLPIQPTAWRQWYRRSCQRVHGFGFTVPQLKTMFWPSSIGLLP